MLGPGPGPAFMARPRKKNLQADILIYMHPGTQNDSDGTPDGAPPAPTTYGYGCIRLFFSPAAAPTNHHHRKKTLIFCNIVFFR